MKITSQTILLTASLGAGLSLTSCSVPPPPPVTTTTTSTRSFSPGYTVDTLPGGYRTEVISGKNYYYNDGAYYQRRSNRYEVVTAPRSSRYYDEYTRYGNQTIHNHPDGTSHAISKLPRGYTTVDYRGTPYYRHQNTYYRRQGSNYVTVANPF